MATYTGTSIVDYLKSVGQASDYASRAVLAQQYGIAGYAGTAEQNTQLLGLLKDKASTTVVPATPAVPATPTAESIQAGAESIQAGITALAEPVTVNKEEIIDWLKRQPGYKDLPQELKDDLIAYADILQIQDIETQKSLLSALNLAVSQADPYFAEIIRVTKDELSRAVDITTEDYESQQRDLQQRISQLQQDLATGKERLTADKQVELARLQAQYDELEISKGTATADFESQEKYLQEKIRRIEEDLTIGKDRLSVDEQAELARLKRGYEVDLENLREAVAQSGLTFSSKRSLAEQRLATEHEDIVESTKREFQRKLQDLQLQAERGDMDAKRQLEEYERQYGETIASLERQQAQYIGATGYFATTSEEFRRKLQDLQTEATRGNLSAQNALKDIETKYGRSIEEIGREAEKYLGTAELPDIKGYTPLGGVRGQAEEEKLSDIMSRAQALGGF